MIPENKRSIGEDIQDLDHSLLKNIKNIIAIIMIIEKGDKEAEAKINKEDNKDDKEVEAKTNKKEIEIEVFPTNENKFYLQNSRKDKIPPWI